MKGILLILFRPFMSAFSLVVLSLNGHDIFIEIHLLAKEEGTN